MKLGGRGPTGRGSSLTGEELHLDANAEGKAPAPRKPTNRSKCFRTLILSSMERSEAGD